MSNPGEALFRFFAYHVESPLSWLALEKKTVASLMLLVRECRPDCIVDLGALRSASFFAFCRAIRDSGLPARCLAFGSPGEAENQEEQTFRNLLEAYAATACFTFTTFSRRPADEAAETIAPESVDMLHLDSLRSAEELRHDVAIWLPKLKPGGFLLVRENGTEAVWETLKPLSSEQCVLAAPSGLRMWRKPGGGPLRSVILRSLLSGNGEALRMVNTYLIAAGERLFPQEDRDGKQQAEAGLADHLREQLRDLSGYGRRKKAAQAVDTPLQPIPPCGPVQAGVIRLLAFPAMLADHGPRAILWREERFRVTVNGDRARFRRPGSFVVRWPLRLASAMRNHGGLVPALRTRKAKFVKLGWMLKQGLTSPDYLLKGVRHLRAHGWRATLERVRNMVSRPAQDFIVPTQDLRLAREMAILTTPHCLFVAELIQTALQKVGIVSTILFERPAGGFRHIPHFVICPQMFPELPGLYAAFQMEQSIHSRWFTPEYFTLLRNSWAILDYSLENIDFLQQNGIAFQQAFYVPLGPLLPESPLPETRSGGVLFYGDTNCPRRRAFLERIEQDYPVQIINNLFGESMREQLRDARIVINVHYYEGALLETTRLYECLSQGCLVVSEKSTDLEQYPQLQELVDFVDIGDAEAMAERIRYWLEDEERLRARREEIFRRLREEPNLFEYFFMRFLLACDVLNFDRFYEAAASNIRFNVNRVCLGLPESTERHAEFERDNLFGFDYFPGLRHSIGWIGCGLSYKFILRRLLDQGFEPAVVCEDDVEFLPGWDQRFAIVQEYLDEHKGEWDLFSGLIADLHPDTRILGVDVYKGLTFVTLDRTVSTVLNVYTKSFSEKMQDWDEQKRDTSNTIDRYMESMGSLRVVALFPFLIGHKEEMSSTLWGISNSIYTDLCKNTNTLLERKIREWQAANGV